MAFVLLNWVQYILTRSRGYFNFITLRNVKHCCKNVIKTGQVRVRRKEFGNIVQNYISYFFNDDTENTWFL